MTDILSLSGVTYRPPTELITLHPGCGIRSAETVTPAMGIAMKWSANRWILGAGFCLAMGLLVTIGALSYWNTARLVRNNDRRAHARKTLLSLQTVLRQINEAETGQRGFIITGEERYLETYHSAEAQSLQSMRTLREWLADNTEQEQRWIRLQPLVIERFETLNEVIGLRRTDGFEAARKAVAAGRGKETMNAIREHIAEMQAVDESILEQSQQQVRASTERVVLTLIIGTAATVMLLLLVFYFLTREVKDRRRAEEQVIAQGAILRSVIDSMGDGVAAADEKGKFVLFNKAGEQIMGLGSTELPPEKWSAHYGVFMPDGVTPCPPAQLPLARAIRGESVDGAEIFVRNGVQPEGVWVSVTGRPLVDREGKLRGGVVVFRDISRNKDYERRVKQLNDDLRRHAVQLESANKELEAFAYSVSHDLRAPLRSIDGFSQALLEDYHDKLDADGRNYLQRVRLSTQRMADLIDDLLNLSRVTRAEIRHEKVDLSALAHRIVDDLRKADPDRHVEFIITPGLVAHGDPRLLRSMLENLIGNAWKFTSRKDVARIEFTLGHENGTSVYMLRDNGAGFDMAYADKLFGAFQRLHATTEFKGTGIGLATVQRIVHRHGGRVWAEGTLDAGATFYFTL